MHARCLTESNNENFCLYSLYYLAWVLCRDFTNLYREKPRQTLFLTLWSCAICPTRLWFFVLEPSFRWCCALLCFTEVSFVLLHVLLPLHSSFCIVESFVPLTRVISWLWYSKPKWELRISFMDLGLERIGKEVELRPKKIKATY